MKVVYRSDESGDRTRTLRCDSYEEFDHGFVLYDAEDEEIGYVPVERLLAIEAESA